MSVFWSILDVASSIAFFVLIPLVIWQAVEERRLRKRLEDMEPAEVVASARLVARLAPAMLTTLHAVQQAEHSKVKF